MNLRTKIVPAHLHVKSTDKSLAAVFGFNGVVGEKYHACASAPHLRNRVKCMAGAFVALVTHRFALLHPFPELLEDSTSLPNDRHGGTLPTYIQHQLFDCDACDDQQSPDLGELSRLCRRNLQLFGSSRYLFRSKAKNRSNMPYHHSYASCAIDCKAVLFNRSLSNNDTRRRAIRCLTHLLEALSLQSMVFVEHFDVLVSFPFHARFQLANLDKMRLARSWVGLSLG